MLIDYLCRVRGGELRPASDVTRAEWVASDGLAGYDITAGTRGVIERALSEERRC